MWAVGTQRNKSHHHRHHHNQQHYHHAQRRVAQSIMFLLSGIAAKQSQARSHAFLVIMALISLKSGFEHLKLLSGRTDLNWVPGTCPWTDKNISLLLVNLVVEHRLNYKNIGAISVGFRH